MASKGRQSRSLFFFKLVLGLLIIVMVLTLVTYHALSSLSVSESPMNSHKTRIKLEYDSDPESTGHSKLMASIRNEIEELRNIKMSVNNELRDLDNKRLKLQADISTYSTTIDGLKTEYAQVGKEVQQIQMALEQIRFEQEESKSFIPNIKAPTQILHDLDPMENLPLPASNTKCQMESCFDFSQCSLVSGFPVYFYDPDQFPLVGRNPILNHLFSEFSLSSLYRTREPSSACVFVVLLGNWSEPVTPRQIESHLASLPYWRGDGRNHLLVTIGHSLDRTNILRNVNIGRAVLAQSFFSQTFYRKEFDIVLPSSFGSTLKQNVWKDVSPLSPVRRKYLLSFWGEYLPDNDSAKSLSKNQKRQSPSLDHKINSIRRDKRRHNFRHLLSVDNQQTSNSYLEHVHESIVSSIKNFQVKYPDKFYIDLSCPSPSPKLTLNLQPSDWRVCGSESSRKQRILESTFNLILSPLNTSLISTLTFQLRVIETLRHGAVPVILGTHGQLPFAEILHWRSAALFLPTPRVTEIPFFLMSIPDTDIASFRLQGRQFYTNHFGSFHSILETTLAVIRNRLQIPPHPIQEEEFKSSFPPGFTPLKYDGPPMELETDEVLGPLEAPLASETYRHNFTYMLTSGDPFNNVGDPFHLYPYTPFTPLLPSEAKFTGSGYGFRPVGSGTGGDGINFSQALGGNSPREQFTIVMLTFDREVVLIQALQRFQGLPYLNKVIVVWNNPEPPAQDLKWPDIGVPVKVAKTKRNSLNNRFLPYDVIETEAILSIDDDAHLRHDEIVFGFRVWREERSRVVGFPGRFHAWDLTHGSWNYNSNYSCELSMVLTGAAFFHKYYAYQYSYVMPQAIRDKVDEFMNCEDIAMNFLVAHISRKPPVKVTSRWTFRCPGCPTTLSSNSSHFEERHQCINFFSQVYGYTPLLYTQYRVDSVLFKTRISHDKTKCFKYI